MSLLPVNARGRLRMRFVRALANRIPTAAVGNLALLVLLLLLASPRLEYPALAFGFIAWMVLVTACRVQVARSSRNLSERSMNRWFRWFGATTIAAGLTWGFTGALWLYLRGFEPLTVLVMVMMGGVLSVSAHVSAPSLVVLRAFTVSVLLPSVLVLVTKHRDRASGGLAIMLVLFAAYLWFQGRSMHAEFFAAQVREYRLEKQTERLRVSRGALHLQATRDGLTGTLNRAACLEELARENDRARRECRPLSVVMLDIDHFKKINDAYGHAAGDAVLRECASRLRAGMRPYDTLGRLGGEEFVLVLPGCDHAGGLRIAERLRSDLAMSPVALPEHEISVTASFGVALSEASDDAAALLARADARMYEAKRSGRDRVV